MSEWDDGGMSFFDQIALSYGYWPGDVTMIRVLPDKLVVSYREQNGMPCSRVHLHRDVQR